MKITFTTLISCICCGLLLLIGCAPLGEIIYVTTTASPPPTVTPTNKPALTTTPSAMPSVTPVIPDSGWVELHTGMERRVIHLFDEQGIQVETLLLLRVDPAYYRFEIAYNPEAQTLVAWQTETNALVVVNGGYYRTEDEKYIPTGLTVVDGKVIGVSYDDFAGMLAITAEGPELRWLAQKPFDPQEPLIAALQSFPLLVKPGGEIGFPQENEDNQQARRTVIGEDRSGHILLMVASQGYFTLHQLSAYLAGSDFDMDIAINLDGGPSSGLLLADPYEEVPALSALPVVITIHPR